MCGIAGVVGASAPGRVERVRAMCARLVHRGPDSEGAYADEVAALGVRRLRIIDLITGDQPLANEAGSVWTVFNGEIYNFAELREELVARGHRFRTSSDTEVIPHLYEELGERFVERIDGMFAVAVWDALSRTLVLARDRLGKKPLLYRQDETELAFASEHAALLVGLRERPGVDPTALHLFLRLGYVPSPHDAFVGVRKLPPAHVLVWRDGRSELRRYWSPPEPASLRIDESEAVAELRRLFEQAVRRRLVADVPLGAFLSGGIDSSAVVATMARLTSPVRTFTIGFEEAEFSELRYARRVSERYATEHHEYVVRPLEIDGLVELVRHYGEPYADSSALPTYHLARVTRHHVTVALNGDGGDELFAGYDRYVAARLAGALDRAPHPMRAAAARIARALPERGSARGALRRARRFLAGAPLEPRDRYLRWIAIFDEDALSGLLAPEFAARGESLPQLLASEDRDLDPVMTAQAFDLGSYLPDDLLVKVDIASMATSLEVRSPFLDRELVEFAVRLPLRFKMRGLQRKYLVKRAFADRLSTETLHRSKQGFGVPVGAWMRTHRRAYVEDVVLSPRALGRGYFRPGAVERLVREHMGGRADHTQRLWALLVLELWHREFVDCDP